MIHQGYSQNQANALQRTRVCLPTLIARKQDFRVAPLGSSSNTPQVSSAVLGVPSGKIPKEEHSLCILVVDDDLLLVNLMGNFLSLHGVKMKGFTNGKLAVDWYKTHSSEVLAIFLDMQMPIMSGSECFREFRKADGTAMVVLMSGGIEQHVITELLSKGAARFFRKPFDYPTLISWTLKHLGQSVRLADVELTEKQKAEVLH